MTLGRQDLRVFKFVVVSSARLRFALAIDRGSCKSACLATESIKCGGGIRVYQGTAMPNLGAQCECIRRGRHPGTRHIPAAGETVVTKSRKRDEWAV